MKNNKKNFKKKNAFYRKMEDEPIRIKVKKRKEPRLKKKNWIELLEEEDLDSTFSDEGENY